MRALLVVKREVARQPDRQLAHRRVPVQVHVFVLDVAPQALDEDVIQRPAPAVHADGHAFAQQHAGERLACELDTLVSVKDVRLAVTDLINAEARLR